MYFIVSLTTSYEDLNIIFCYGKGMMNPI